MIKQYIYTKIAVITGMFSFLGLPLFAENAVVKEIQPYVEKNIKTVNDFVFYDESSYVCLSEDGQTIDRYEIESGKKIETIFDVNHTRETTLNAIDGFIFSPDNKKIIVWNDKKPVYRRSFEAKYYFYDTHSRQLKPVAEGFDYSRDPLFSPDSRMIAFVHDNNIYLKKLDYNTQVPVTADGKKNEIINGATDWTYEEEFVTTSLMAFSPDNTSLCYVKSNEKEVPLYTLPLYAGACDPEEKYELYPGLMSFKYPVAGQPNSKVTLHAYEIANRKTKDIEFTDKSIEYIPRIDFVPNDDKLLVTTLNRDQNRMEIYAVNPKTTLSTSVFVEQSEAWILPSMYEGLKIVNDGFIVLSPRSGWNHVYKYAFNGTLNKTISQGDFDVTDFYGADAAGNFYVQAAYPSPINRTLYKIDAKGQKTALHKESGYASARFSPNCKYALLNYSDNATPPRTTLINDRGKEVRVLADNADLNAQFTNLPTKEFIQVPGESGLQYNGYIIKPNDFNENKKYPVVVYQYSGPGSQNVLNKWDVSWEHFFASKGYIIFCVDGRGTGGRGTSFMFPVYKKLGYYETIDQISAVKWLSSQKWVDSSRIGIHGWSYGGYETLMCLQADNNPFAAGVAIAPVTDWRLYDTVYAERYMLTPQQNFDGYRQSAPLNFTNKMDSRLLLMLGTKDDNVHPANTYEYASRLQYEGTLFDMMVFPNKNHSIYGCNARAVVYGNMFRFFNEAFSSKP